MKTVKKSAAKKMVKKAAPKMMGKPKMMQAPQQEAPMMKMGGAVKAKKGGSFPDLNKDGKITKADVLKGRGVIAKKGASVTKCKSGCY